MKCLEIKRFIYVQVRHLAYVIYIYIILYYFCIISFNFPECPNPKLLYKLIVPYLFYLYFDSFFKWSDHENLKTIGKELTPNRVRLKQITSTTNIKQYVPSKLYRKKSQNLEKHKCIILHTINETKVVKICIMTTYSIALRWISTACLIFLSICILSFRLILSRLFIINARLIR